MKALYQCAKIAQSLQHKTIIRFGLIVFLFKSLMYLTFQQQQKTLRTNYTFFVKPTFKQEGNDKFLKSTLTLYQINIDIL